MSKNQNYNLKIAGAEYVGSAAQYFVRYVDAQLRDPEAAGEFERIEASRNLTIAAFTRLMCVLAAKGFITAPEATYVMEAELRGQATFEG